MQLNQLLIKGEAWNIGYIRMSPDELPEHARQGYQVYLSEGMPRPPIGQIYKVSTNGWVYSTFPFLFPRMRFEPMNKWQRFQQRNKAAIALITSVIDTKG